MDHILPAPLLPKLRGLFAEFLLHGSLEHLRLLASPTFVGFRSGRAVHSRPALSSAVLSSPLHINRRLPSRHPVSPLARSLKRTRLHRCIETTKTRRSLRFRVLPTINTHSPARES